MHSPLRVLVVEDSPLIRRRLLDALARLAGFETEYDRLLATLRDAA